MDNNEGLTQLGVQTKLPESPEEAILEAFENKHPDQNYVVSLLCNEFTCICPITGQPDFAKFEITYIPREKMVESKSLKLYLFSYRNKGEFHEDVTNRIFKDLWNLMDPKYMRLIGDFNVRGGIAIKPLVEKYDANLDDVGFSEVKSLILSWDRSKHGLSR